MAKGTVPADTFVKVPTTILDLMSAGKISRTAAMLYVVLLSYVNTKRSKNGDTSAWPRRRTLAAAMNFSTVKTVDGYLNELIDAGLVFKEMRCPDGVYLSNVYTLTSVSGAGSPGTEGGSPETGTTLGSVSGLGVGSKSGPGVVPVSGPLELEEEQPDEGQPDELEPTPPPASSSSPPDDDDARKPKKLILTAKAKRILAEHALAGAEMRPFVRWLRAQHIIGSLPAYLAACADNGTLEDLVDGARTEWDYIGEEFVQCLDRTFTDGTTPDRDWFTTRAYIAARGGYSVDDMVTAVNRRAEESGDRLAAWRQAINDMAERSLLEGAP